jgi:prepilin-type N-terminal cleavage/methylation domain-containing protein
MTGDAMSQRDAGFTLIEAIVATAVFALLLSALYQGLTTGWRGIKKADAEEIALSLLSQKLASAGVETPLQASASTSGAANGVAWQTQITAYAAPASATVAEPYQGSWVTVTVRWKNGPFSPEQALQATTLKLRRAS